jgi:hypothetical protein
MSAHCESGTVTALLNHGGLSISEAMVFGISGAIFFGYFKPRALPFPTFVLRNRPGYILDKASKHLGVRFRRRKFRDPDAAMAALDQLLEQGIPVAVQVDMFLMDYIPAYARAHFNAHYVVVVGKEGDRYRVSDSYSPQVTTLSAEALRAARFARGDFAPKGLMFHLEHLPDAVEYGRAIRKGIRTAVFYMLRIPLPFMGVRGIRYFARKLPRWPQYARDLDQLAHETSMIAVILEERGTGGGGFRFLYATFLQEASRVLNDPALGALAKTVMEHGDRWRALSLAAARFGKKRDLGPERFEELAGMLRERAEAEKEIFTRLGQLV